LGGENETQIFELDLDNEEFLKKTRDSLNAVRGIGKSENLLGLTEGLADATKLLGVVGVAALALKATMDAVFEGEQIKAINYQFDLLSKNAGLATEELKNELKAVSEGFANTPEVLKASNKAIVELGKNAKELPQLFEVATKVTKVFGGDVVGNFEAINQAVATGNLRILKHMGIIVDADKATKEYAKAHGLLASTLNESGKQHAIMEAVIKKANQALPPTTTDVKENESAWRHLKIALNEAWEAVAKVINDKLGKKTADTMQGSADIIKEQTDRFVSTFGSGQDQIKAQIATAEKTLDEQMKLIKRLEDLQTKQGGKSGFSGENFERDIASAKKRTEELDASLEKLYAEQQKREAHTFVKERQGKEGEDSEKQEIDLEKQRKQRSEFEKSMLELRKKRVADEMSVADSYEQVDRLHMEEKKLLEQENQNAISEIKRKANDEQSISQSQARMLIEQQEMDHKAKLIALEQNLEQERLRSLDNYERKATGVADGVSRGMMAASKRDAMEVQKFAKLGAIAFDVLKKRSGDMFIAMGEGAESAGDLMKGFMFNSLADIAEAEGRTLLGSALINPANGAAGAALLILSGVLRSQAKKSGGGLGGGSGGGGGGDYGGSYEGSESRPAAAATKKAVNISVQGNYFETEQTKQRLVEMIREHTDATDFAYKQIGQ
jgi:hypothetical protein